MQAKRRNSGWRGIGSSDPCSVSVIEAVGPCKRLETHSRVSGLAKFTSSRRILQARSVNLTQPQNMLEQLTSDRHVELLQEAPRRNRKQTFHYFEHVELRSHGRRAQIQSSCSPVYAGFDLLFSAFSVSPHQRFAHCESLIREGVRAGRLCSYAFSVAFALILSRASLLASNQRATDLFHFAS